MASGSKRPLQKVKNLPSIQEIWVPSLGGKSSWRRKWQPTPVFLPEELHGQRSLVGYSPWGYKEWDITEYLTHTHTELELGFTILKGWKKKTKENKIQELKWKRACQTICGPQTKIFTLWPFTEKVSTGKLWITIKMTRARVGVNMPFAESSREVCHPDWRSQWILLEGSGSFLGIYVCVVFSSSVASNSLWPHGL